MTVFPRVPLPLNLPPYPGNRLKVQRRQNYRPGQVNGQYRDRRRYDVHN